MGEQERSWPLREHDSTRPTLDVTPDAHLFDRQSAGAFASYLALSLFFFGRGLFGNFSSYVIGKGPDPGVFVWLMTWWPHAIIHSLNPLLARVVFAPGGANLAWAFLDPLAMLLALPLTLTAGPIAAHNAVMLVAPALDGWAAFVLCRYLARSYWPAWLGGYIFSFSPYILGGMQGHEHVLLVFPIPLMVWLALRRLAGEISVRRLVVGMVVLLIVQFGCLIEALATVALAAAIAFGFGLLFTEGDTKKRLWSLVAPLALACATSAALLSFFLYFMFAYGFQRGIIYSPWLFSADLFGFIIPSPLNALGQLHLLATFTAKFQTNLFEAGAYISPPLFLVVALYARSHWRTPVGRLLVDLLIIMCVLTMGPWLEIAGRLTIGLPWLVLGDLPLLNKALPARLSVYVFLILAIIVSIWFSSTTARAGSKGLLGAAIVLLGLPNLAAGYWIRPVYLPSFFSTAAYRQYLAPGEVVLVLPFGWQGDCMLWQASTDMYFNLAGGYVSYVPLMPYEYTQWPITMGLYNIAGVPDLGEQLKTFLANHSVSAIIVGDQRYQLTKFDGGPTLDVPIRVATGPRERGEIAQLLETLGIAPLEIGGVRLYRIPPQMLAPYRQLTALEMQQRAARARFEALLLAAQRYLARGRDPAKLTPQAVQALGLVPLDWFGGKPFPKYSGNPAFNTDSTLAVSKKDTIEIGIEGSYPALKPIIDHYGDQASAIYFPYPSRLTPSAASLTDDATMMVLEFDRTGLAHAAAGAATGGEEPHKPAVAPPSAALVPTVPAPKPPRRTDENE
ncbi:MAG: hypothetical protein WB580_15930 [Candidatus Binataceae bacterium]